MQRPALHRCVQSLLVVAAVVLVVSTVGTPVAAQPDAGERSAIERPGVQLSVGAVLVVGGAVVLVLTNRLLRLAWSFTAGVRPRSDIEYVPLPPRFVRFVRAMGGVIVLAGVVLVGLGVQGGVPG